MTQRERNRSSGLTHFTWQFMPAPIAHRSSFRSLKSIQKMRLPTRKPFDCNLSHCCRTRQRLSSKTATTRENGGNCKLCERPTRRTRKVNDNEARDRGESAEHVQENRKVFSNVVIGLASMSQSQLRPQVACLAASDSRGFQMGGKFVIVNVAS